MAKPLQQDYPLQGIVPEHEAQETKNQQVELLSFSDRANQYRKHHLSDELIERVNKPANATSRTSVISKTTQAVVAIARQKLCKTRTEWFMSDSYMAKVTKCERRQNRDIIGQINGTKFTITRCRKRKGWVLKRLEIEYTKRQNIAELKNPVALEEQKIEATSYKNNNIRNIRSNAQAHESKFLNNSNSSNSLSEQVETTEAKIPATEVSEAKVLVSKKKFKSNIRKKPTVTQRKASKAKVYKFNQYDEPKNLTDHYPLSQEDCYELQKRSLKLYNQNAMNEILLDLSRKLELQGHTFVSKAKFMAYITKVYREEGRDIDKANSPTFKIMKRRPKAEVVKIATLAEREKCFASIEIHAMRNPGGINQFKARVVQLAPNQAYDFVVNLKSVKKVDNVLKVCLFKSFDFTQHFLDNVLDKAKGIGEYMGVDKLEFAEV